MASAGDFFWYELMSNDTAASTAFYGAVLGWGTQDTGMDYTVFTVGGAGMAGMMALPAEARAQGARPSWIGYVWTPGVDDAVAAVQAQGGKVWRPAMDIPEVGRFAVVADAQGATFSMMAPIGPSRGAAPAAGTPGYVGWHELHAADGGTAFDFYAGLFGWRKTEAHDMGPAAGVYQTFATTGAAVGGMMTRMADFPVPMWVYYFNVAGIDQAVGRISDAGGTVVNGPHQVPGGSWIAQALDPQGALFAVVGPRK